MSTETTDRSHIAKQWDDGTWQFRCHICPVNGARRFAADHFSL